MSVALLPLAAATHAGHPLHATDRVWTETNCYVDVWVEVLHALGLDPLVAAAFAVATDFEGDQWTFFKYPADDLWTAYGIDVHEMNPWRSPVVHVEEQLRLGRLMTLEADAFHLPDTAGVSYRSAHVKSTIVANLVDRPGRRLGYFHNAGYFELQGDDFDGVFRMGAHADPDALAPYTELVRLDARRRLDPHEAVEVAAALLDRHRRRAPADNPVVRLADRVATDLPWLRESGPETYHLWAFATLRQCGAAAELAAAFCGWLGSARPDPALLASADRWTALAHGAKSMQFALARAARGRTVDLEAGFAAMAEDWQGAQEALRPRVLSGRS